jgi:pyridoxine/pyridoxamine 5'-phosphate oxidase
MARGMLIAEQSIATNGVTSVTPWTEARDRFAEANRYWLATVRADGRPHIMPVFGVWVRDVLYFTAARTSRKAKNLALNARCVVAADVSTLDVVVEGEAVRVSDEANSISWLTHTRPSTSGSLRCATAPSSRSTGRLPPTRLRTTRTR